MNNRMLEDIREVSGLDNEHFYLSEGIVFFKNSSKIKKLSHNISKKLDKAKESGKFGEEVKIMSNLVDRLNTISIEFERVEKKYILEKSKEKKQNIKKEYANLEEKFSDILTVIKEDNVRKAMIVLKVAGAVVAILLIGFIALAALEQAGVLAGAASNVDARAQKMNLIQNTKTMATSTNPIDRVSGSIQRNLGSAILNDTIANTNNDLMKAGSVFGATAASVATASVLGDMKKNKSSNKTFADTIEVVEKIKQEEKWN